MGFGSKCSILNGQVIYIEKSKLNITDMRLIPLIVSHMFNTQYTLVLYKLYFEKSKLNIADMWLIPLDRVTYAKI